MNEVTSLRRSPLITHLAATTAVLLSGACASSDRGLDQVAAAGGTLSPGSGGLVGQGTTTSGNAAIGGSQSAGGVTGTSGSGGQGGAALVGGAAPTGGKGQVGGSSGNGGSLTSGGSPALGGAAAAGGLIPAGGAATTGGSKAAGGTAQIGGASTVGGTSSTGGATVGGSSPAGGVVNTGGTANGGTATGGVATGGSSAGGAATGGAAMGGAATGGAATGGAATGGAATLTTGVVGFAAVSSCGGNGTYGGSLGPTVTATTAAQLISYAASATAQVIQFSGTLNVGEVVVNSNKTILGIGADATLVGGLHIWGTSGAHKSNIIVKNVHITGPTSTGVNNGDAITISYSDCVWVDHCDIHDSADGNLDIIHASNYVTVSWTKFWYSNPAPDDAHRFSNLMGTADTETESRGLLKTTFHHNWWADRVSERMPRTRFGQVHLFNNYYSATGNSYCVGAGIESNVLIENNHFQNVDDPYYFFTEGGATAIIGASGNNTSTATGRIESGQGTVFTPPYAYTIDPVANVSAMVQAGVGPK